MIKCTTIGVEPSPICYEICVLAYKCSALKAWEKGEVMSDLINRQDAIDALSEDIMGGLNYRRILQSLPSADKLTGWISVSERSPEKNGCYLVSTTGENNYIVDIAYYIEGMWHKASRIKAWMPLPEPYREDGGDD